MSDTLIAWQGPDGLALTVPADGVLPEDAAAAVVPKDAPRIILPRSALPNAWDFLSAWDFDEKTGARVNIARARDVHRDRIRAARAPALRAADVDFIRAIESSDDEARAAVAARRQALRDLPASPEIEAAGTLADLRAFWPSELLGPSPYAA